LNTPRPDSQSRLHQHCMDIIAQRKQQFDVAVTFTIGRIVAKPFASQHPAGDTGSSFLLSSPVNLPAVDQCVDGGLFSKDVT